MITDMSEQAPSGWYTDGKGRERYWDGTAWTEHFRPLTDPNPQPSESKATSRRGGSSGLNTRRAFLGGQSTSAKDGPADVGELVTAGVFGAARVEIYSAKYVRVAEGGRDGLRVGRISRRTPYEKLRVIRFTGVPEGEAAPALDASSLMKGASLLVKGGSGVLKASAPGLAVAGLSQMAKAKMGKTYLTISTDRATHVLTNETHNGLMKVVNKGHNDVGLLLEEAGNAVLGLDAISSAAVQTDSGSSSEVLQNAAPTVGQRLRELAELHRDGVLSDHEFSAAKAKLLDL